MYSQYEFPSYSVYVCSMSIISYQNLLSEISVASVRQVKLCYKTCYEWREAEALSSENDSTSLLSFLSQDSRCVCAGHQDPRRLTCGS